MKLNLMNLRLGLTKRIDAARQHPKNVVLGIAGLFFLNLALFIVLFNLLVGKEGADLLLVPLFLAHMAWPILLIIFGFARLRRGKGNDELEIKRRREVTLRYFAISTLFLLILLIPLWRYNVETRDLYWLNNLSVFVIPIEILSGLLVLIAWHWMKNSENKLSVAVNKAPPHYLLSAITLVITLILYIEYGDLRDLATTIRSQSSAIERFGPGAFERSQEIYDRYRADLLFQITIVCQIAVWVGAFTTIGSAVLGYLRPSEVGKGSKDKANRSRQIESIPLAEPRFVIQQLDSTSPTPETSNLEQLLAKVELNNSKLDTLVHRAELHSHSPGAAEIVAERVELIRGRLTGELKELSKRGNLNLMIGILTTFAAASALFWGLIATQPSPTETQVAGLLRHYLPRISFAVFIEVFSFFFLRLYKNSLEDIKYYHNELTNLDSRLLALEVAAAQVPEALTSILLGLLNTDRNFILKSGESTVELEKVKTEQQYMRTLINTISNKIPDLNLAKTDGK